MAYSQAVKDLAYSRLACINMYVKPFNRACIFLHEMYDIHRHGTFEPGVTQSELAMMLNMHKVTMANIISQLKREKIVGHSPKQRYPSLSPRGLKNSASRNSAAPASRCRRGCGSRAGSPQARATTAPAGDRQNLTAPAFTPTVAAARLKSPVGDGTARIAPDRQVQAQRFR